LQRLAQVLVLDPERIPELGPCPHRTLGQTVEDSLLETAALLVRELVDDLQVGCRRVGRDQLQRDRRRGRRDAVLAGEHQVLLGSSEIQVRVAEGMKITGAAQSQTGDDSSRGVLAGVMH
jgi:hypothetical protein